MNFRWNDWNCEHVQKHGITVDEAQGIVLAMRPPYPERIGDDKLLVVGAGRGGRLIQVVFVLDPGDTVFVIHARPLTDVEKKRFRRRHRR